MNKTLKFLVFIGLTTVVLIAGVLLFIRTYTKHSQDLVKVPHIEGLRIDKAIRVFRRRRFSI